MTDKFDVELYGLAGNLTKDQTDWITDNIIPGGKDFSLLIAVDRESGPSVWVFHSDGTTEENKKSVTVTDKPGSSGNSRCMELLRGTGSHCVVYKIGGKRIVVCW